MGIRASSLLRDRRFIWNLVIATALATFVFVFFVLPPLLVPPDVGGATEAERLKLRNDVRSAATQFLGGLALVTGLVFTARTLRLNREGQLTDRFSKAIEQLGHEKLDLRLGGIYALERIARDSPRDHGPVMEVLTAYVRRYERTDADPMNRTPYDVQAIMNVVGRRTVSHDVGTPTLDLMGADLRWLRLDRADLRGASLMGADLTNALIMSSSFDATWLTDAKMGATFANSALARADLSGTDFTGAQFDHRTRMDGAQYDERTKWGGATPDALGARRIRVERSA
jgi:hypothetical protein